MADLPGQLAAFAQANPLIAGAVGLVLLYLLLRQTKQFLFLLVLLAVLAGVFFVIEQLVGVGGSSKRDMIEKTGTQDVR